jgi:fructose/tagatose bisphosphate aldolase
MAEQLNNQTIKAMVKEMVFSQSADNQNKIYSIAKENGIYPASIQKFYELIGKGLFRGFTVPAINIRGLTYDFSRAVFRSAVKNNVGAFVFELARSEMNYTKQSPAEFAACILAAAIAEGYKGPVFLQGDHMQVQQKSYINDSKKEVDALCSLIRQSVDAGFYNIDIDASTMVDISKSDLKEQQELNGNLTALLTEYTRSIEPDGITISIGGEIGEIGKGNSTIGDLRAFMQVYNAALGENIKGISKISVQTGTSHGGVPLPDGTVKDVKLDFETLGRLSKAAREEYGMGGAVQHGASTLPDEMFDVFPRVGALEIHLATGFQNLIFESNNFPEDLLNEIYDHLDRKYASDRREGETEVQFHYRNRKRAFGDFKKQIWEIPEDNVNKIGQELEERFSMLFHLLNVVDTREKVISAVEAP